MWPARTFFQGKTDGLSESNTHGSQDLLADIGLCTSICVVVDLCLQAVNIGVHHFQTGAFQSVEVCIAAVLGSIQAKLAGFLSGLGQDVLLLFGQLLEHLLGNGGGYGTIFTITLLKGKAHFENDGNTILLEVPEEPMIKRGSLPDSVLPEEYKEMDTTFPDLKVGSYKILIVEDNEELLQILNTLFTPFYQVILAGNGEEGLRKTIEEKPDLVVSDVMMPLMSGMEMCMKIKNNIDLCHIPVVLLTALDSVEYNIEGFQQGADDYVSKPFHARVLLMRCNNLIRNRLLLKSRLTQQGDFDVQLLASTSLDQKLLNRIVEIIDEHMGDQDFDVNILARELNMGRSSFFAKMKNLTGMTPSEFIQNQRIKRAAVLLQERPDMLVSEISDQLGFVSTIYFSRCFKTKFGISPAQFRKKEK